MYLSLFINIYNYCNILMIGFKFSLIVSSIDATVRNKIVNDRTLIQFEISLNPLQLFTTLSD